MNSIESNKYKDYFQPGTSLAHVIEEYQSNQSILSQTDSEKLSFNDSENCNKTKRVFVFRKIFVFFIN